MKKNKFLVGMFIICALAFGLWYAVYGQANKKEELAVITNSGSTNFAGYTLLVNQDGSGSLHCSTNGKKNSFCKDKTFPQGTFQVHMFSDVLLTIGDVVKIPINRCFKSISFGSKTTVTYKGKTSGDITCMSQDKPIYQGLVQQVEQIQHQAFSSTGN